MTSLAESPRPDQRRRPRSGPAPGALPLIGHSLPMARRPLEFLRSLSGVGDLVEIRMGRRPAYLTLDPDLMHQVLVDTRTFDKGGPWFDNVMPTVGVGLGTADWSTNKRQRRQTQPAFRHQQIEAYAAAMATEVDAMTGSWRAGETIDMSAAMYGLTLRITIGALFASHLPAAEIERLQSDLPLFTRGMYRKMVVPLAVLGRLPTPANRRFARAERQLHETVESIIDNYDAGSADGAPGDLLSTLLGMLDERTGEPLTRAEIHLQVLHFLTAGVESTAGTLAWCLHEISTRPDVEQRLQEEVDEVLDGRAPAFEHLPRLLYTRRLVNEVLRVWPGGWLISRVVTADTELAGVPLPAGSVMLYSPYATHHDPGVFPDPERFDPDRWLPDRVRSTPRNAFVPFASGSRKCIGEGFALVEMVLAVAAVGARWRLRPPPGFQVRPRPRISLGTGPLPLRTDPR